MKKLLTSVFLFSLSSIVYAQAEIASPLGEVLQDALKKGREMTLEYSLSSSTEASMRAFANSLSEQGFLVETQSVKTITNKPSSILLGAISPSEKDRQTSINYSAKAKKTGVFNTKKAMALYDECMKIFSQPDSTCSYSFTQNSATH